jgi:hypothetical protein
MKKNWTAFVAASLVVILFVGIMVLQKSPKVLVPKNIENEIKEILPEGSFLRDYQKLEGVKPDSYLVVFIDEGYEFNESGLSCPGMILGLAIQGDYHLALIQDMQLVNSFQLASVYDDHDLELVYKDIWSHLNFDTDEFEIEKEDIEIEKLLDLRDFTGDGKEYEFLLITTGGGCGFFDGLVAGYDEDRNKVVTYSKWIPRFSPDEKGEFDFLFECGDHGNMARLEKKYEFNEQAKEFEMVWEKETDCSLLKF